MQTIFFNKAKRETKAGDGVSEAKENIPHPLPLFFHYQN
jgi:hypothetical protein